MRAKHHPSARGTTLVLEHKKEHADWIRGSLLPMEMTAAAPKSSPNLWRARIRRSLHFFEVEEYYSPQAIARFEMKLPWLELNCRRDSENHPRHPLGQP